MLINEEKTEYQKIEEKLVYVSKNIWSKIDNEDIKKIFQYGEMYKEFLQNAKTERLTISWIKSQAERKGYRDLSGLEKVNQGGLYYLMNRKKNIALIRMGKKPLSEGINFIIAHADAPRLDLKQVPLVEDIEIALFKTHYYGGIKKYHWLNIPLALIGIVVTAENREIEIEIGLKPQDPVFIIPDLLPHLSKKVQDEKKAKEFIEGETLSLVCGNIPVKDEKVKEKVKLAILEKLNRDYGIVEEDLISAELEAVPAAEPRDVGLDCSMIGGYGHDDRISTFSAVMSLLNASTPEKTAVAIIFDKEEIGSDGPTGAKSLFAYNLVCMVAEKLLGSISSSFPRSVMEKSVCISADVNAAMDPMYKSVHDEKNAARLSHGVVITKYTGVGGKYSANDADAELVGRLRKLFNDNHIFWQYGGLGKVDEGGGGTIAKHFAFYNTSVIDCGVPVLGMHSPFELISKADLYYSFRAFQVFFEKGI